MGVDWLGTCPWTIVGTGRVPCWLCSCSHSPAADPFYLYWNYVCFTPLEGGLVWLRTRSNFKEQQCSYLTQVVSVTNHRITQQSHLRRERKRPFWCLIKSVEGERRLQHVIWGCVSATTIVASQSLFLYVAAHTHWNVFGNKNIQSEVKQVHQKNNNFCNTSHIVSSLRKQTVFLPTRTSSRPPVRERGRASGRPIPPLPGWGRTWRPWRRPLWSCRQWSGRRPVPPFLWWARRSWTFRRRCDRDPQNTPTTCFFFQSSQTNNHTHCPALDIHPSPLRPHEGERNLFNQVPRGRGSFYDVPCDVWTECLSTKYRSSGLRHLVTQIVMVADSATTCASHSHVFSRQAQVLMQRLPRVKWKTV